MTLRGGGGRAAQAATGGGRGSGCPALERWPLYMQLHQTSAAANIITGRPACPAQCRQGCGARCRVRFGRVSCAAVRRPSDHPVSFFFPVRYPPHFPPDCGSAGRRRVDAREPAGPSQPRPTRIMQLRRPPLASPPPLHSTLSGGISGRGTCWRRGWGGPLGGSVGGGSGLRSGLERVMVGWASAARRRKGRRGRAGLAL